MTYVCYSGDLLPRNKSPTTSFGTYVKTISQITLLYILFLIFHLYRICYVPLFL